MYNIVIIGGGELGSRHLQGLKNITLDVAIYVVDINPDALKVSKDRFEQGMNNEYIHSIKYLSDIDELPSTLDLIIIATSSLPRADITQKLLERKCVKNIIFEKFLFPALSDYEMVSDCLERKNVKAWVNCPRRMFLYYKNLELLLADEKNIYFDLKGGEWGLACNSIHFIDVFAKITKESFLQIDVSGLDMEIKKSKRNGYIEFTGIVKGKTKKNHKIKLSSIALSQEPTIINISTDRYKIQINESASLMKILNLETKLEEQVKIEVPFQSQLTGLLAEQVLLTGNSDLPTFAESAILHKCFLLPIISFYNNIIGHEGDFCPIT